MRTREMNKLVPASARELVLELIGQVAHLPKTSLAGDGFLRELGIDSLRHMQLMLEAERMIGREFGDDEAEAILSCATVDEVCDFLVKIVGDQAHT